MANRFVPPNAPPEWPELCRLARDEFGRDPDPELLCVWMDRIRRAGVADVGNLPLPETIEWVKKTAPPRNLFGEHGTMGELLKVLTVVESGEGAPDVMTHARNRLAVIRATESYKELAEVARRRGLL